MGEQQKILRRYAELAREEAIKTVQANIRSIEAKKCETERMKFHGQ